MAAKTKNREEEKEENIGPEDLLDSYLKNTKEDHLNFEEEVDYKVSSGSLILDIEIGGGFGPGAHRFSGFTESGKEQPVSEPVLTPTGWKKIGELKVGDEVIDSNGNPQTVLAVYPQGIKDVYEVEFEDGSTTRCGEEHLWETSNFVERTRKEYGNRKSVKQLKYIENTLGYGHNRLNHSVRMVKPIAFSEKKLPIDPYLLGVLIGDGGITCGISLTNADQEIWDKILNIIERDFPDHSFSYRSEITNNIIGVNSKNLIIKKLKDLNLFGRKSHEKFIPKEYLFSSIKQRTELLNGLVDTDGFISKAKSGVIYYSSSKELCDNVLDLVRSLGGIARKRFKKTHYLNKNGKRIICKDCWMVSFHLPEGVAPCFLKRKLDRYKLRTENFCHFIKNVKKVGKEESVCIKVSSLDSLYVTKDFILTHNSSAILQIMKNFLTMPNTRGVYVKTEGRLSKEMQRRSGVSFTFDAKDWKDGVCFVFECNVYETVFGLLRQLMTNNPDKIKYFFVIDSSDGLILRDDLSKPLEEAAKVAGGALITSVFMKKVANAMAKRGHMFFTTGQVRSEIKLDPYAKVQPRLTSSTGGNAILHYSNFILEFEPHLYSKDVILENPKEKPDRVNNRPLGHWCKVEIKKSTNESSGIKVAYPIRYGRTNGTSIWREYELMDLLVAWKFVTQKGSWIEINFPENIKEEMQKRNIECEPKVQGQQKLLKMLEDNGPLCDLLCEKFKEILMEK